jgi:hypothetical protein
MTSQLETELRGALHARAAHVPDSAAVRLAEHDYRPRTRRLRPPVAIGAVATGAAVGTAAVVISLGAGASNAFAGWTPAPTPPAPGQLTAAREACARSQSPVAGLPLAIADTRGPFTLAIYADSTSTAMCINGPSFMAVSESGGNAPVTVPAGHVQLASVHRSDRGNQAYGWAIGRTGDGVSGVTLVLDDRTKVQATVANGWFVGWWPSGQKLASAELTTPAGVITQAFDLPYPPSGSAGEAGGFNESGGSSGTGTGFSVDGTGSSQ